MGSKGSPPHVRTATLDDLEAVLEVNRGMYVGFDYMEAIFTHMCQDPSYFPCVLEIGGKVVGFHCVHVVENCTSCVLEGTRVHTEFKGQGLGLQEAMMDFTSLKVKDALGKVVPTKVAAVYSNFYKSLTTEFGWKLKRVWKVVTYKGTYLELQQRITQLHQSTKHSRNVLEVGLEETIKYLTQDSVMAMLRAEGEDIVYSIPWCPHTVSPASLIHISKTATVKFSFDTASSDSVCEAVSLCSALETMKTVVRCDIYYYGKPIVDILVAHFASHAKDMLEKVKPYEFRFMIHFPKTMDIQEVFKKLGEKHTQLYDGKPELCVAEHTELLLN